MKLTDESSKGPNKPAPPNVPPRLNRRSRWIWKTVIGVILAASLILGTWFVRRYVYLNFATVEAGSVYRCAQPTKQSLSHLVGQYGIVSVLNLRGANPDQEWYRDELSFCKERGINHYDVALSARSLPPPDRLSAALDILHDSPKPLLIHCWAGADRTGLVSALYRIIERHEPIEKARDELSLLHGHWRWGEAGAMDTVLNLYATHGSGMDLRTWVNGDYRRLVTAHSRNVMEQYDE